MYLLLHGFQIKNHRPPRQKKKKKKLVFPSKVVFQVKVIRQMMTGGNSHRRFTSVISLQWTDIYKHAGGEVHAHM